MKEVSFVNLYSEGRTNKIIMLRSDVLMVVIIKIAVLGDVMTYRLVPNRQTIHHVLKNTILEDGTDDDVEEGLYPMVLHLYRVLQRWGTPALLRGLLLHRRVGYHAEHPAAGRAVSGLPIVAHRALPHYQLHERVFHMQEHAGHRTATLQVTNKLALRF